MGRNLARFLIALVVLLVLVNIPFSRYSLGLAQLVPQTSSRVFYEGMLLKGGGPEIYVLQEHQLRLINSPEALKAYFNVDRINVVEDSLLGQFEQGRPVRRLLTCKDNPVIYAVENGQKRLFSAPLPAADRWGWDRVHLVRCSYLEAIPDGPTIDE